MTDRRQIEVFENSFLESVIESNRSLWPLHTFSVHNLEQIEIMCHDSN